MGVKHHQCPICHDCEDCGNCQCDEEQSERAKLFDGLFEIAEKYDIKLTNSPDMHPGVPEIGDFCGDIEKLVLSAGYRPVSESPVQMVKVTPAKCKHCGEAHHSSYCED